MIDLASSKQSATILVVDGTVLIRMPIAAYWRRCGYRVFEAATIDEAVQVLTKFVEIDVMLMDAETKGVGGLETGFALSHWAKNNRPGTRVLLAGTPRRDGESAGRLCEQGPTLSNPYDPQLLQEHILRLLAVTANS